MMTLAPWLAFSLFGLLAAWIVLAALFIRRIRQRHPAVDEALGRPVMFKQGAFQILGYVFRLRHRSAGDPVLSMISYAIVMCYSLFIGVFAYAYYLQHQVAGTPAG